MNHRRTTTRSDLNETLASLEEAAGTPILAGDLRGWCANVRRAQASMSGAWRAWRRQQAEALRQIVEKAPALSSQVDSLRDQQTSLDAERQLILQRLRLLLKLEEQHPERSAEPLSPGERLRSDLLQWILACRTHAHEVESWYQEAHYRVWGGGD